MAGLPAGTITFLFTDLEDSTPLWERHPEAMQSALARHDAILRDAIDARGGSIFKTAGDAFFAVFAAPLDGIAAAIAAQQALLRAPWEEQVRLIPRVALHTGLAQQRGGDYFGSALNRVARLLAAGHSG